MLVIGVRSSWPGVLHEPSLLFARAGQRAEHAVEGGAQTADLVVARGADRRVEPTGRTDVLRRRRQAPQRSGDAVGDHHPDRGGDAGDDQRQRDRAHPQAAQDALRLVERPRHLERAAGMPTVRTR